MCVSVGQRNTEDKAQSTYSFVVTHGAGGGIYTGASLNRDERFGNIVEGMDCIVTAHVHKGFISKPSKIVIDSRNKRVVSKHYVVVSCVSWLNYGGYAARAMLLPAQVCGPQRLRLIANKDAKKIETTW